MSLVDRVAVVTGGASGIGEAIARALATEEARVVLLDRNIDAAERIATDLDAVAFEADVSSAESVERALLHAAARVGDPDILVNSAGIAGGSGPLVDLPLDTECTDLPGSPQAFTWLDQDVTGWASSSLRVSRTGRQWSVMGWSTGGYCAALLHLRDPGRFAAAASVEGYFSPEPDSTTGDLGPRLSQDPRLAHEYNPTWLIEHRPPLVTHLLVMTSTKDPQSRPQSLQFMNKEKNVPGIQPYVVKDLGHSLDAYAAVLPPILGWLADVAGA